MTVYSCTPPRYPHPSGVIAPDQRANRRTRFVQVPAVVAAAVLTLAGASTAYADDPTKAAAVQSGASICVMCHGMHGQGSPDGVPRLAGQNVDYMSNALSKSVYGKLTEPG